MPTDHTPFPPPVPWHNLAQDQKDRLLEICQSLSRTILDTEGLEETLDLLAEKMLKTGFLPDLGVALVYPHERQIKVVRAFFTLELGSRRLIERHTDREGQGYDLDHSTHPLVEVVRTGTVRINNKDPLCLVSSEAELPQGWTSYLVPVKKGEGVLAVLATCSRTTAAAEQRSFLQTLEPLVDQVALALEHARLRGELHASQERALQAQKMEAVGQLTAGIAHNFNNILQSIMGNLQLALLESSEPISTLLSDAERSSRRAADMVRQLMLFARRNPAWTLKPVELRPVVEDGVSICRKTFDKKIELSVDIPDDLPLVHGDAGQLGQILLNLCLNARDALEAQDPSTVPLIQISLEDHVLADHQVGMLQAGAYICLQVADNGMGIELQAQEHIFEPFFTTKEVGKGTGLGLATVYAIVRNHQGWIDCQSAKEKGTIFRVYLPVSSHAVATEEEQQLQSRGGAETILVVDDEEAVRRSLAYALQGHGYQVVEGVNGADGLALFQQQRARLDLVILDLSMPFISGTELLQQIRTIDPSTKVIIFTGQAVDEDLVNQVQAVIPKPTHWNTLLKTVRSVLDR